LAWADDRGIVAVELALFAPVLVLLLIGLIDLGLLFHRQLSLDQAVRAGADYAVITRATPQTVDAVRAAVLQAAPEDSGGTRVVSANMACLCDGVTMACSTQCPDLTVPQAFVTIDLGETMQPLIPYPFVGQSIRLVSTSTVRVN
jgi:Flp pilus assembly protein TadG